MPPPHPPQEPLDNLFVPVFVGEEGVRIVRRSLLFLQAPELK